MRVKSLDGKLPNIPVSVQTNLDKFGLGPLSYELEESLPLPELEHLGTDDIGPLLDSSNFVISEQRLPLKGLSPSNRGKWLRLTNNQWVPCKPPSNQIGYIDTETVGVNWAIPMLAVLVTRTDVYCFVAKLGNFDPSDIKSKIPLGQNNILWGYNVSFDRAQFQSSYQLDDTNVWVDLMSINSVVNGYSNQQRSLVAKHFSDKESSRINNYNPDWITAVTNGNSLMEVCRFYGIEVSKQTRNQIIELGINAFIGNKLYESLKYCYKDVLVTNKLGRVFIKIMSKWDPIIIRGLIERNREIVTLSPDFKDYFARNEKVYNDTLKKVTELILEHARTIIEKPESERTLQEQQLDWTTIKSGKYKDLPVWFRKLKQNPSINVRDIPYILGIKYRGLPVIHRDGKWYYGDELLPHPETGKPLVNSIFVKKARYECEDEKVSNLIEEIESLTNWKSNRKQVSNLAWVDFRDTLGCLIHIPQMVPFGTITRRKTDTWCVLPNPKAKRIGTEARTMIKAPPSYELVTFDVDSEEALIASLIGDAYNSTAVIGNGDVVLPGSCPFSYATILGDKDKGTDVHSIMGRKNGIERQQAKTAVYGSIYGQGKNGCINTLYQAGLSERESIVKGELFISNMRGLKNALGNLVGGLGSGIFNGLERKSINAKTIPLKFPICHSLRDTQEFSTTRKNWVIQATGSDILDIVLSGLRYLCNKNNIPYRVVITIHDSVSVLTSPEHSEKVALFLAISHLKAWMMVYRGLGFNLIPVDTLIPSSIEVGVQYKNGSSPTYSVDEPHRLVLKRSDIMRIMGENPDVI